MDTHLGSRLSFLLGCAFALSLLAVTSSPAHGQGRVVGTVTDAETNEPVAGVQVTVEGAGIGTVTGQEGTFSIDNVPAGTRTLDFTILGFESRSETVSVAEGGTTRVEVALEPGFIEMGEITTEAASRTPSRIVEAPAAVSVIGPEELERQGAHGQLPELFKDEPGIDVVQSGIQDFNINARGYNSSLNRRVLVLQDGIDRSVGFLQAQEWTALSMPLEDLGKLEFVRGPGSALYGANAFSGVLTISTPDPAAIAGTKLAFSGGQRETGRFDLRHAGVTENRDWGYKANVGYWAVGNSFSESRTRADARGPCPPGQSACIFDYGPLPVEAVEVNDDPVQSWYGSARVDRYFGDGSSWTAEAGNTHTDNGVFVTGIGRVQVNGAHRPWARTEYASERFNVMAWYSGRRATEVEGDPGPITVIGNACIPREECEGNNQTSLQSGALLLESSDLYHVEAQGNWQTSDGDFVAVAGASNRWISVDTKETLMEEEKDDTITSVFGQLEYQFHPKLRGIVSGRFDHFTVIDEDKVSPKAALVFTPNEDHAFRATFNQAFQTPNYSELFLRVAAGAVPLNLIEQGVEAALSQQAGMPVDLPLNFQPTPVIARGNDDLEVEELTGWEIGWKGTMANGRVYATVDAYYNEIDNFVTDLLPGVNPDFPQANIVELIPDVFDQVPQLRAVKPIVAAALLDNLPPFVLQSFTIGPDGEPGFVISYTNAGEVAEQGVEFGITFVPRPRWEISANYTFFDFEIEDRRGTGGVVVDVEELRPNTPEHKGNLSIAYNDPGNYSFGLRVHAQEEMDWAAGVFAGEVPGFVTLDLDAGWQATDTTRLHLVWSNVLDKEVHQLYGGSVLGSRAIGGATFTF
ncbi:MAG: TonB-dependent receptor [Gemmatimonadota bacterium]|nr:TonB-dependent receptor [Gemmatimonadota bacterium]